MSDRSSPRILLLVVALDSVAACGDDASSGAALVARPDDYSVVQDQALEVPASAGVLANDSAPEGRGLSATLAAAPTQGELELQPTGAFRYIPPAGFTGAVGFTYVVRDDVDASAPAAVGITVRAATGAPVARPDTYHGVEDTPVSVEVTEGVLANDEDPGARPVVARLLEQPGNGTVFMAPTGGFTYTPRADFFGVDTFVYGADNGDSTSRGVVTIELQGTPDAPRATGDRVTGPEDVAMRFPGTFDLLANDLDPDGDGLTFDLQGEPMHGTLTEEGDGTLVYTPERDYLGTDSFQYVASDGTLSSNVATVVLALTPVNDAPVARPMLISVVQNRSVVVLLDAEDVDGDELSFQLEEAPRQGTAVIGARSGAVTYTPAPGYLGVDSFRYSVSDGELSSEGASVQVEVVPQPPPAVLRLFPERGSTQRPVQLFGAGFLEQEGTVTVGGRAATVLSWSDRYVVIELPAGYAPGPQAVVVTAYTNVSGAAATYTVVPWIDGVSRELVRAGDTLELEGDGFGGAPGSVRFGGVAAQVQSWSPQRVVVTVPAVSGEQPIELTAGGGELSNVWRQPVAPGTWVMPPVPSASERNLAVWTGTEIIYLYGRASNGGRYDPRRDRWRPLARAPVTGGRLRAVWSGRELLVFGTNYGAAYDPRADEWRALSQEGGHLDRSGFALGWADGRALLWGGRRDSTDLQTGALYDPATDSWTPMSTTRAPPARSDAHAVWTGTQMVILGGSEQATTGGRYDPALDRWRPTSTVDAPAVTPSTVVAWTGEEVLVQGGGSDTTPASDAAARYHPLTDTWTAIAGAPFLNRHAGVWTGREFILRGGCAGQNSSLGCTYTDGGVRWDPATDQWAGISSVDTPIGKADTSCVWTGKEMVAFGGGGPDFAPTNDGGRYDPRTDTWTRMDLILRPVKRTEHVAAWTGAELMVWGGGLGSSPFFEATNAGARYHPVTGVWTPMSLTDAPAPRMRAVGVWTGAQLLVWGGDSRPTLYDSGGRYTLATDGWQSTASAGAPQARRRATAVWTGSQMIVWGGEDTTGSSGGARLQTGGRYDPSTDVWSPTSLVNAPTGRLAHTAVWTGTRMLVWGGDDSAATNTGARYDPATNSWTTMSTAGAPSARTGHVAAWTGERMLVYGGGSSAVSGTGGRYDPVSDSWTAMSTDGAPSVTSPIAAWTGERLLVHGPGGGGSYDPLADAWSPLPPPSLPSGTAVGSSVWTGSEWLIFGPNHGYYTDVIRYVP